MNALHDLAEALLMHPWRTAFMLAVSAAFSWVASLADGINPAVGMAPIFACYCLGLYIRICLERYR